MSTVIGSPSRTKNLRAAVWMEAFSLGWMVAEAAVALWASWAAGSLLLATFGADSVIELISAAVLYRRLQAEASGRMANEATVALMERRASRAAGLLLYALSVFVILLALFGLTHQHHADTSWAGLALAVAAAFGMPVLARAKIRVADVLGSRALRADALETFTCGFLSWALLGGLALNALLHWWWLDAAASLAVVPFLLKEAREAITGECGCHP